MKSIAYYSFNTKATTTIERFEKRFLASLANIGTSVKHVYTTYYYETKCKYYHYNYSNSCIPTNHFPRQNLKTRIVDRFSELIFRELHFSIVISLCQ